MRYNYLEQRLLEGPPYQVYSRSTSDFIPLTDKTKSLTNFLSSLSQIMHDLDLNIVDSDDSLYSNGLRAINEAFLQAKNGAYLLGNVFGNVFNYVMYNAPDTDQFMLDTVAKGYLLTSVNGMYTRSNGERVLITDMQDTHLYRAFRRKLINKFGLSEENFLLIDKARDTVFLFLLMSLITTSTLIDTSQFDNEMKDLLDEIINRSDQSLQSIW